MKKEAIASCRVSSRDQLDNSSLESQEKHVYDLAHNVLNCEIEKIWSLDTSSKAGRNLLRRDLEEIKDYCKKNRNIKYFIVDKVNRLMREADVFFWYMVELKKIGVKTYFADPLQQNLNQDDPATKLRLMIEAWQAEAENVERANTTITRMKDRYLLGYRLSNHPQGYKKSQIRCLFVPDEPRFTLLQTAMRNIISGRETISESMVSLTNQGYLTPTGKKLRIDRYKEILVNDFYAGLITVKKWKDDERFVGVKGLHQSMITLEEHKELISIVEGRKRIFERRKDNLELPLGNIGICECGGKLVGFYHHNKKNSSWKSPKYRCRSCGKQYHAPEVHASLDQIFENTSLNSSKESEFVEAFDEVWKEEESYMKERKRALETRLGQQNLEKSQIVRKLALNNDPDLEEEYKTILNEIKTQIETTEADIADASKGNEDFINFTRFGLKFINENLRIWKQLDRKNRVKCKQLAFPGEIIVNFSEKVCTPRISPILISIGKEKEAQIASKSHMVDWDEHYWNTFLDTIFEWESILKYINNL